MRRTSAWIALAVLAVPSIAFARAHGEEAGPPVVPYLCNDGETANVIYDSGNDYLHASVRIEHGGRTEELRSAPTLYGVRYRAASAPSDRATLAWTLRGEEAVLSEAPGPDSYTLPEREVLRCTRIRSGMPAAGEGHGEGHGSH
jgi:hypothetical protein